MQTYIRRNPRGGPDLLGISEAREEQGCVWVRRARTVRPMGLASGNHLAGCMTCRGLHY